MIARNGRFTAAVAGLAVLAAVGCGGGRKKKTEAASTAAVPTGSTGTVSTGTSGVSQVPSQAPTTPPGGTVTVPPVTTPTSDVYVTSFLLGQLQLIDAATLQVKQRIQVGKGPTAVTVNGSYVYVTNALDKNLVIVDRLTNTIVSTIDVSSTKVTGIAAIDQVLQPLVRPTSVAVTPNGEKAFTANLLNVTSVDLIGRKPLKSIFALNLPSLSSGLSGLGAGITSFLTKPLAAAAPARVACTKSHAWVTNLMTNNVTMISATDDKVISNLPVGKLPFGIAVANGKVYVACAMSNEIVVLNESTGAPVRTIKSGMMPFDITASPAGDRIYVANLAGGDVTEIDTALDLQVGTLPAGLPLASILTGMGINIPGGSGSGLSGALSGFLGGFLGGSSSGGAGSGTSTLGGLLGGLLGGSSGSSGGAGLGSILSPMNLVNALMSGMLGYMGINSSSISNFKLPGIGIASVTVTAGGDKMIVGNWFMGTVTVTDLKTLQVGGLMPGTTGIGPASVAGAR